MDRHRRWARTGRYVRQRHFGFGREPLFFWTTLPSVTSRPGTWQDHQGRGRWSGRPAARSWRWRCRAPGVMAPADYDLAGFTVGVVDRPKMLRPRERPPRRRDPGLPSTGVHSNGYSLVRRSLASMALKPGTPEAAAKAEELSRPSRTRRRIAGRRPAGSHAHLRQADSGAAARRRQRARHRPHHWRRYYREPQPRACRRRRRRGHPQQRRDGLGRSARHHLRVAPSSRPTRHARPSTWALACA